MATTAFCYSAKSELAQAAHCFNATLSGLACTCSSTVNMTGLASTAGIAVGMAVTGTNAAANTVVAAIVSATALTLSVASTGALTSATFTADAFKFALVKGSPVRTFDGTQTNIGTPGSSAASATNLGTDESSGTGYTSGGFALTNISPQVGSTAGYWSFSVNPSWTSASFNASAGIVYNNSTRLGGAATPLNGRTISVHDFGGSQTVTAGTFTVLLPTNAQGTALLQIS
jgi:hypothetical protein